MALPGDNSETTLVRLSLLDRLIDERPDVGREAPLSAHQAMERAIEAARRDLQDLLNSRLNWTDDRLATFPEAARSLLAFGLPDFSHENLDNPDSRERVRAAIERTIRIFEPRLSRATVVPEPARPHQRSVRFRIEAVLRVDPLEAPVTFDTVVESSGIAAVVAS